MTCRWIDVDKALLKTLQHQIVEAQAEAFYASKSVCQGCRRRLRKRGTHVIRYRTVFGDIPVNGPRYYRCRCKGRGPKTFSPLGDLLPDHTRLCEKSTTTNELAGVTSMPLAILNDTLGSRVIQTPADIRALGPARQFD